MEREGAWIAPAAVVLVSATSATSGTNQYVGRRLSAAANTERKAALRAPSAVVVAFAAFAISAVPGTSSSVGREN